MHLIEKITGTFDIKTFLKSIRIPSNSLKWLILLVYPLVIAPIVTSCAVNPATGSANLVLMSENREKEIGLEEHEKGVALGARVGFDLHELTQSQDGSARRFWAFSKFEHEIS